MLGSAVRDFVTAPARAAEGRARPEGSRARDPRHNPGSPGAARRRPAARNARPAASQTHVYLELGDHLGSTSAVLDVATGELVERATSLAYGATESDYRPGRWNEFREDYRFTGKEEDVEVGLQYFGKRFLSPQLGRWVSADPLAVHVPGGADLNVYAYVHGAVLAAADPLGLEDKVTESRVSAAQSNTQLGDAKACLGDQACVVRDGTVVDKGDATTENLRKWQLQVNASSGDILIFAQGASPRAQPGRGLLLEGGTSEGASRDESDGVVESYARDARREEVQRHGRLNTVLENGAQFAKHAWETAAAVAGGRSAGVSPPEKLQSVSLRGKEHTHSLPNVCNTRLVILPMPAYSPRGARHPGRSSRRSVHASWKIRRQPSTIL